MVELRLEASQLDFRTGCAHVERVGGEAYLHKSKLHVFKHMHSTFKLSLWKLGLEAGRKGRTVFVLCISVEEGMNVKLRVNFIFCAFLYFQMLPTFYIFKHYLLNNECVMLL